MHVCPGCGFVFNAAFDPTLLSYGDDYDNNQNHSPAFAAHVDKLVSELVGPGGLRNVRVAEAGCGDGAFLRRLIGPPDYGNVGFGFDPAYRGPDTELGGRLNFYRTFYDKRAAELAVDAVISRHVIEHVPAPLNLLSAVRLAATQSTARVFFETPCVNWILEHEVVWDFFYEHCSLFTLESLGYAFRAAGFEVTVSRHVFGEQYLWVEAKPAPGPQIASPGSGRTTDLAARFAVAERDCREHWSALLDHLTPDGPVAVWGAGAKGVTFCNLLDPTATRLRCLVDVNPAKQGRFLAGTGHPIIGPDDAIGAGVRHVLVLNPNYMNEIRTKLAVRGAAVGVHDLMSAASPA
jgi:hypothetical protein